MNKKSGPRVAAEILNNMTQEESKKIQKEIREKDPRMAKIIESQLVKFEDILLLTDKMLIHFLQKISLKKLGISLRNADKELQKFILTRVSTGMREEINDFLENPQKKRDIIEAREEIMIIFKDMISKGEIVLRRDDEEWV